MLPLVEFPLIVQHYAPWFESVFSPEAWIQFQRYLSGLLVSENKTVQGINRLFVIESRHQSSLNRLLTQSPFSEVALNRQRLALLNSLPRTQVKPRGVLSVDDTLLTHYGKHFEHIAYLFDHVEKRYTCYVVTLASDDQVILKDGTLTLEAFVAGLKREHEAALAAGQPPVFS